VPSDYYSESAAKQRSKKVKKFLKRKKKNPKTLKAKKKKDYKIKKIINLQDTNSASKSNATKLMQMPCSSKNQKLLKYSQ